MSTAQLHRYIRFLENLQVASLQELGAFFDESARFIDPFNDARGHVAIRRVFEDMFARCEAPRFVVDEATGDDAVAYLRWRFSFGPAMNRRRIEGVSRVQFGTDGRVVEHVDYWDPARQLYETVPLLGRLMRALRRHLSSTDEQAANNEPGQPAVSER